MAHPCRGVAEGFEFFEQMVAAICALCGRTHPAFAIGNLLPACDQSLFRDACPSADLGTREDNGLCPDEGSGSDADRAHAQPASLDHKGLDFRVIANACALADLDKIREVQLGGRDLTSPADTRTQQTRVNGHERRTRKKPQGRKLEGFAYNPPATEVPPP